MRIRVFGWSFGLAFAGMILVCCEAEVREARSGPIAVIVPDPADRPADKPAAETVDPTYRVVAEVEHGRVEDHRGLRVLRLWGTPAERGAAHAELLADEILELARKELSARFAERPKLLNKARLLLPSLVKYPKNVGAEIKALFAGLEGHAGGLALAEFGRDLDLLDLQLINAMDILAVMGCSGMTLWGDQVEGGGVLTGRNFDWRLTGDYMVDSALLIVQHPADGKAFAAVSWPGYVGAVTGVNEDGVATFLHVGNSERGDLPVPGRMPTAVAAREILRDSEVSDAFEAAHEFLRETSAPAGYLTRVVLPRIGKGQPARVFEADRTRVTWRAEASHCVVTNHFLSRKGERNVSTDSKVRRQALLVAIGKSLEGGGKASVADVWTYLASVDRGGANFGTLHSLVFRNDPWVFELAIAEFDAATGVKPATRSTRRYRLPRAQVFASVK